MTPFPGSAPKSRGPVGESSRVSVPPANLEIGLREVPRQRRASDDGRTSVYLAFMSQRLTAWLACERSRHPSTTTETRNLLLNSSVTEPSRNHSSLCG